MNLNVQKEIQLIDFLKTKYKIIKKIGEGTFSMVFQVEDLNEEEYNKNLYVIKAITRTTSPNRIIDELKFLKELRGKNNIIPLLGCHRHEDQICVIFPYFEGVEFREFLRYATVNEIKEYMYNLLLAIKQCHDLKIIHRDIKPNNFLYNPNLKKGYLIDFGLAQRDKVEKRKEILFEDKSNIKTPSLLFFNSSISRTAPPPGYYIEDSRPQLRAHKAGTRGYRAPEVLFRSSRQTCKIDIWSAGVIFLMLCCKQHPFFNSSDELDSLVEIATIFGHEAMRKVAKYYERVYRSNLNTIPNDSISFETIVNSLNSELKLPVDGFDLMYKMLELNGDIRISAEDALKHPFFK
ncbi:cell cycle protein kinase CDC7 subfamily [Tubulinosema ratisbonensis]|uniref:non-specific serine/threonine protein kinase n=1 Tax=Tubulinosema ratisbonensis TaxID=291195 RepID=A0A437AIB3_9MICR|nr:cell cycle protein kinase CDC7 subfamily [Tubulinosema ratisbonensis]